MVINDSRIHVGNQPLTIIRNGDYIIVRTGNIPQNVVEGWYILCLCYSSMYRNLRRRRPRGRRAFLEGSHVTNIQANSTYTFALGLPRKWGRRHANGWFSVRAEIRYGDGRRNESVYYSNIIYITI